MRILSETTEQSQKEEINTNESQDLSKLKPPNVQADEETNPSETADENVSILLREKAAPFSPAKYSAQSHENQPMSELQQEITAYKQKAQSYIETIKKLLEAGYQPSVREAGTIVDPKASDIDINLHKILIESLQFKKDNLRSTIYSAIFGKDPLTRLLSEGRLWEVNPDLHVDGGFIPLTQFEITTTKTKDGKVVIALWDYLNSDNPLAYSITVNENEIKNLEFTEKGKKIQEAIRETIIERTFEGKRKLLQMQKKISENSSLPYNIADYDPHKELPPTEREKLQQFYRIMAEISPYIGFFSNEPLTIDATVNEDTKNIIVVNGDVSRLTLETSLRLEESGLDRKNRTLNGLPIKNYQEKVDEKGNLESIEGEVSFKDKYGNLVEINISYTQNFRDKNKTGKINLFIKVNTTLPDIADKEEYEPIKIDLSPIGFSNIEQQIFRRKDTIINTSPPYLLVSVSKLPTAAIDKVAGLLPQINAGINIVENMFGFASGDIIKRIRLMNSKANRPNGYVEVKARFEGIVLSDDLLLKHCCADIFSRHEALHSLDSYFSFQLSSGALADAWVEIARENKSFFSQLDEKSFFDTVDMGGHSSDNPAEFFASLGNSLLHPKLKEVLAEKDSKFLNTYLKAIKALKQNMDALVENGDLSPDCSFLQLVSSTIELTESLIKEKQKN